MCGSDSSVPQQINVQLEYDSFTSIQSPMYSLKCYGASHSKVIEGKNLKQKLIKLLFISAVFWESYRDFRLDK